MCGRRAERCGSEHQTRRMREEEDSEEEGEEKPAAARLGKRRDGQARVMARYVSARNDSVCLWTAAITLTTAFPIRNCFRQWQALLGRIHGRLSHDLRAVDDTPAADLR